MEEDQNYNLIRIVTVGDIGIGKQSIIAKYCNKKKGTALFRVDFFHKLIQTEGMKLKLQICIDNEYNRNSLMINRYVQKALGIIFLYDITNRKSFQNCINQINTLPNTASVLAIKMLIGNKTDDRIHREVSYEEGQQLAHQLGILFYETSAENNININQAMESLIQQIKDKSLNSFDPVQSNQGLFFFQKTVPLQDHLQSQRCY